ncbi:MAG TPA: hypothetical protein PKH08_02990, partial [Clostridia bacterium]|nr:hypothetical protein [Clostridia bacterium]
MKKRIFAALAGVLIIALVTAFGVVFSVDEIVEVYDGDASATGIKSGDIAGIAEISIGDNILSINETEAKDKVSEYFSDNSIDIYDIERVFPNKVIIKIKHRLPIAAVTVESGGYALADIDFQLNKIEEEADFSKLVFIEGVTVKNTFNIPELKRVREGLIAAKSAGFSNEALASFIEKVNLTPEGKIVFTLRSGGVITIEGQGEQLSAAFKDKYSKYL